MKLKFIFVLEIKFLKITTFKTNNFDIKIYFKIHFKYKRNRNEAQIPANYWKINNRLKVIIMYIICNCKF